MEFRKLWKEASDALIYSVIIYQNTHPLVSRSYIQQAYSSEFIGKRWASTGIVHPARKFLEEVTAERPEVGRKLLEEIRGLKLGAGFEPLECLAGGVLALAGIAGLAIPAIIPAVAARSVVGILLIASGAGESFFALTRGKHVEKELRKALEQCGAACEAILNA
jgi:hypothetical protein